MARLTESKKPVVDRKHARKAINNPHSGFSGLLDDFADGSLDLNELLVRNPPATFHFRINYLYPARSGLF
jgi:hypothetical protein